MSFRFDWINASTAALLGTLAVVACQTPGADWQASAGDSGGASNANATATTGSDASAASTMGGASSASTSAGDSTGDGASETSGTSDSGATSDSGSTTTDGSDTTTTDGGGATSSTETSTSSGGSGGGSSANVIDNSDFSTSENPCVVDDSDWVTEGTLNWAGADEATCGYCVVLDPDQTGQLNWTGNSGTSPTLDGGTTYRFSFDVWSPEGDTIPTLSAKVGQPVEPYDAFLETDVTVSNSPSNQSFTFTMDNTDQVGIAFFLSAPGAWGKICFDNVVIEPQ